jgi:hypothetical protein
MFYWFDMEVNMYLTELNSELLRLPLLDNVEYQSE